MLTDVKGSLSVIRSFLLFGSTGLHFCSSFPLVVYSSLWNWYLQRAVVYRERLL